MKTIILFALVACTTSLRVPPSFTKNVERDVLEQVVHASAEPPIDAVVLLVGEYLAEKRIHEGYAFFHERATAHPESPLYESLDAFFDVQLAPEVSLLSRIGHVDRALARLDRAAERAPRSAARLFRAFVLARLPERFGRGAQAVTELEALVKPEAQLPLVVMHDVWLALAQAYDHVGRRADAERALARSGYPRLDGQPVALSTAISVSVRDGTRYTPEAFIEEAPGVFAAYGFDYGDFYFIVGDTGVIAIDAGAVPTRVARAVAKLREHTQLPITHVILTHAHWDHAGGLAAMGNAKLIASARYGETLVNMAPFDLGKQVAYLGVDGTTPTKLEVDTAVREPTSVTIDGVALRLVPLAGAETADSLIIELPARHVVFAGDTIADLGIPFMAEGSTRGFVDGLARLAAYGPGTKLLHGHRPVGDLIPAEKLAGLSAAFGELRAAVLDDIHAGFGVADVLRRRGAVDTVRAHAELVVPFLIFREQFVQRLFREVAGFWAMDGDGMEPATRGELAAALDLVANRDPARIAAAASILLDRGDFGLAWRITELGVAAHPADRALAELRTRALQRLLERNERWDFFKLTFYAERSNTTIPAPP